MIDRFWLLANLLIVVRAAVLLANGGDNPWYLFQLAVGLASLLIRAGRWYYEV